MRRIIALALAAAVVAPTAAEAGNPAAGRRVYDKNCAVCHGQDGMAVIPGAPNFRRSERLEKPDGMLIATIKRGQNLMPAWRGMISEQDMGDALAYIRTLAR